METLYFRKSSNDSFGNNSQENNGNNLKMTIGVVKSKNQRNSK